MFKQGCREGRHRAAGRAAAKAGRVRPHRFIRLHHWIVAFCLMTLPIGTARAADVEGRVARVGLFSGATPIIRPGVWSFVEVELRTRSDKPFDGQIRIDQLDRDGDVMTSVLPVALAPNGDWRPYQVYFVPYDQKEVNSLKVKLFNAAGAATPMLDERGVEVTELEGPKSVVEMRSDDFLILDLTHPKRLPHVSWLDSTLTGKSENVNARKVRSLTPRELPGRSLGLEAVDAIAWDDADPSGVSDLQIEALLEWVRAGGRLLLTGGKNWQALANSPLARALPVTLRGVTETSEAQDFLSAIESIADKNDEYLAGLERKYQKQAIRRCQMEPVADAVPIPADCPHSQIAYRRFLGRGMVTIVGASLFQLLPPSKKILQLEAGEDLGEKDPLKDDKFVPIACEKVVGRRLLALPPVIEEEAPQYNWRRAGFLGKRDLFEEIRRSIGFEGVGTAFLLFAILFAVAYTLTATTGSFYYMKRRGWQHHSWTAFAAVALIGSGVGTGMVWLLRGFSTKVWQTTVVDGHANDEQAQAFALFGVKSPNHTRLDLRLPVGDPTATTIEQGPLRPVAKSESLESPESRFVASERYESTLAGTALEQVPLRATLKEFCGAWHGPLRGKLEARLVASKNTGADADRIRYEFGAGSYIHNGLGVTLKDCILISMSPLQDATEEIAGERDAITYHYYWLGEIAKSGDGSQLSAEELQKRLYIEPGANGDASKRIKTLLFLSDSMREWENSMSLLGGSGDSNRPVRASKISPQEENSPLLLVSTFNLARRRSNEGFRYMRTYGRSLDCTHQLSKRTALLIGWSDEAPPVVLEKDRVALRPERAHTLYRFVIPVDRK